MMLQETILFFSVRNCKLLSTISSSVLFEKSQLRGKLAKHQRALRQIILSVQLPSFDVRISTVFCRITQDTSLSAEMALLINASTCGRNSFVSFGWYMVIMSVFHFSEYLVTSVIRPQSLNSDSFLLNHSKAYGIAALASWLEFFLELWLIPGLKQLTWLSYTGLVICITGEFLRKLAMLTAGSNFDHLVRVTREANHQLVTSGIYRLFRHPSYVGWFYWSVGTQLVLCNPLCFFAYFYASWKFFAERIFQEEITLIHFFGKEYVEYQKKVPTGLPFIKGYEH
nr:EOG090X0CFU [Eulimnadia texana]